MNIGINGYETVVPRFGFDKKTNLPIRVGSGEYGYQIINSLHKINKNNNYFIYLPTNPSTDLPGSSSNWRYVVFSARKMWTLIGLSRKLKKDEYNLDVFFSPTHYLPISNKKSVISILDVSYLHYPELFKKRDLYQLKIWGKYSINSAKKILTISMASKNDIINEYGVASEKIEVVYPGVKEIPKNMKHKDMDELNGRFNINKEYILFVGTLQPRKNITKLIEAYSKLDTNVGLVVVGKKGWQYDEILDAPNKFEVKDRVIFIHDATDEELPSLYKNAKFFILPSLYEGFGLPVLEAMQYGCPIITSNVSSLPEAGGDAALYIDPENVEDIKDKMQKLLDDEKLRTELIEKGHKHVKKFSWEKSAKQTIEILESVGKNV